MLTRPLAAVFVLVVLFGPARARAVERPFVLWDKQDLAALRQKIEHEPWAKAAYDERMKKPPELEKDLFELLRFAAGDDAAAGGRQKAKLLRTVRSKQPLGGAQWLNVVRYDVLHDQLTADERAEVERVFRDYIEQALFTTDVKDGAGGFNDKAHYSRYDAYLYRKSGWLPNIIFPRKLERESDGRRPRRRGAGPSVLGAVRVGPVVPRRVPVRRRVLPGGVLQDRGHPRRTAALLPRGRAARAGRTGLRLHRPVGRDRARRTLGAS